MTYAKALLALNAVAYAALLEADRDATVTKDDRDQLRRIAAEIDVMVDDRLDTYPDNPESEFRRAVCD